MAVRATEQRAGANPAKGTGRATAQRFMYRSKRCLGPSIGVGQVAARRDTADGP